MAASGAVDMLGAGLVARAASSLMHVAASALVGWGIASARLEGRPWRFAAAYLLAVALHGAWNGSVALAAFGALRSTLPAGGPSPDLIGALAVLAGAGLLLALLAAMLVGLPLISAGLRRAGSAGPAAPGNDIIAPPIP